MEIWGKSGDEMRKNCPFLWCWFTFDSFVLSCFCMACVKHALFGFCCNGFDIKCILAGKANHNTQFENLKLANFFFQSI